GGERSGRVIDSVLLQLLALFALVVCSAVLTGAEAAYFSLGRARLKRMTGQRTEGGASRPLIEGPHDLLVTLVAGITLINIGGAAVAAHLADQLVGARFGLILEMLGMVIVLTTFGEVLPMTLAVKYPEQFLAVAGRPVAWLGWALTPVRAALASLSALTVQLVGRESTIQPE